MPSEGAKRWQILLPQGIPVFPSDPELPGNSLDVQMGKTSGAFSFLNIKSCCFFLAPVESCLEFKADYHFRVIYNSESIFSNRTQQNWQDLQNSVNLINFPCHSCLALEYFAGKGKARLDGFGAPWAVEGVPAGGIGMGFKVPPALPSLGSCPCW